MSPRTPTLPPTEPTMWRKLLARTHPDAGGSHELFIWTNALRETVEGTLARPRYEAPRYEPPPSPAPADDKPRVPYPAGTDFEEATRAALRLADADTLYGAVLSYLADCYPLEHLAYEEERGASYKRLAAIAHTAGMSVTERSGWYRVGEEIPLADRHAGHILSKLKRGRRAA